MGTADQVFLSWVSVVTPLSVHMRLVWLPGCGVRVSSNSGQGLGFNPYLTARVSYGAEDLHVVKRQQTM
jgi:hypothetical protein